MRTEHRESERARARENEREGAERAGGGTPADTAVGVDLNTERLNVIGAVGTACEI
jgi:hypothetical protein